MHIRIRMLHAVHGACADTVKSCHPCSTPTALPSIIQSATQCTCWTNLHGHSTQDTNNPNPVAFSPPMVS